ncbi:MAG: hypothetical protein HYZ49_13755 [Chloroflexi bacterium]|nr:hypothetical protein [Chloroflexota bacterium]
MNATTLRHSDLNQALSGQCPLCGSDQFTLQTTSGDGSFLTQVCPVCGLLCKVVVGPGSPTLETLNSEWAAVFAHD